MINIKGVFKIGIIVFLIGLLGFLGYKVFAKIQDKKDAAKLTETLPEFSLTGLENQKFTYSDLKEDTPVILIFFNTTCDYCQHEAQDIRENLTAFKDAQLVFISSQETAAIKSFSKTYKLYNHNNIYFANDAGSNFTVSVEANTIPYMLIYDKDHKLLKRLKGQTKAVKLLNLIYPKSSL